ncbi:MAG: hypothetical protein AAF990_23490 [Bacteroidota bacterium]
MKLINLTTKAKTLKARELRTIKGGSQSSESAEIIIEDTTEI